MKHLPEQAVQSFEQMVQLPEQMKHLPEEMVHFPEQTVQSLILSIPQSQNPSQPPEQMKQSS